MSRQLSTSGRASFPGDQSLESHSFRENLVTQEWAEENISPGGRRKMLPHPAVLARLAAVPPAPPPPPSRPQYSAKPQYVSEDSKAAPEINDSRAYIGQTVRAFVLLLLPSLGACLPHGCCLNPQATDETSAAMIKLHMRVSELTEEVALSREGLPVVDRAVVSKVIKQLEAKYATELELDNRVRCLSCCMFADIGCCLPQLVWCQPRSE